MKKVIVFLYWWIIGVIVMFGFYSFIKLTNKEEEFNVGVSLLAFIALSFILTLVIKKEK